ncbi:MAG: CorA family divalent cation transporter [Solirubrobacterales bacterium]
MSEIVEGLAERERIAALRAADTFFWVDATLNEARPEALRAALGVPEDALGALLDFSESTPPSRKFHADTEHVVFAFACFLEETGAAREGMHPLRATEVHVLVHGSYLLTVHRGEAPLPQRLPSFDGSGRSEQYVVYAVLDAMVATGFDALNEAESALEGLQLMSTDLRTARVRMTTLRAVNSRLASMRRRIGPQRGIFERISEEVSRVRGLEADSEKYFDRIYEQLNRLTDAIDSTANSMANLIDLRLNETMYWLTVVATIFLPLSFVTGFFGMNFAWMVGRLEGPFLFFALGVGVPFLLAGLTWYWVHRRGTPVQEDSDAAARLLAAVRHPRARG